MAEVPLGPPIVADGTAYHMNFTTFDPSRFKNYIIRFTNLVRNDVTVNGPPSNPDYPGQETFFFGAEGVGNPLYDDGPHYTSAALFAGWPPNPAHKIGPPDDRVSPAELIETLTGETGALFVNDTISHPIFGMSGDVHIQSLGTFNGEAFHTTWSSHMTRFDSGGSINKSWYGGAWTGALGLPITRAQLIWKDQGGYNGQRRLMRGCGQLLGLEHA